MPATRQTPPAGLWFAPWSGNLQRVAFDADSDQRLFFLTPRLGPSSTLVLHRLARQLRTERLVWWDLPELAHCFGLGFGDVVGINHPLWNVQSQPRRQPDQSTLQVLPTPT